MKPNIWGGYNEAVILQITKPKTIDVSEQDYFAEKLTDKATVEDGKGDQRPFIVCADVAVTLKVEHWNGAIEPAWNFTPGPYAMPLRRIYSDAANKITATGVAITTIQIGY
jgi:hypothetical protein